MSEINNSLSRSDSNPHPRYLEAQQGRTSDRDPDWKWRIASLGFSSVSRPELLARG